MAVCWPGPVVVEEMHGAPATITNNNANLLYAHVFLFYGFEWPLHSYGRGSWRTELDIVITSTIAWWQQLVTLSIASKTLPMHVFERESWVVMRCIAMNHALRQLCYKSSSHDLFACACTQTDIRLGMYAKAVLHMCTWTHVIGECVHCGNHVTCDCIWIVCIALATHRVESIETNEEVLQHGCWTCNKDTSTMLDWALHQHTEHSMIVSPI